MTAAYIAIMLGWAFWLAGMTFGQHALYIPAVAFFSAGPVIAGIAYVRLVKGGD